MANGSSLTALQASTACKPTQASSLCDLQPKQTTNLPTNQMKTNTPNKKYPAKNGKLYDTKEQALQANSQANSAADYDQPLINAWIYAH